MSEHIMRYARCDCRDIPIAVHMPYRKCKLCGGKWVFYGDVWVFDTETDPRVS